MYPPILKRLRVTPMSIMADDPFHLLLDRAGLALKPAEVELLKPLFEGYIDQLRVLLEADLRHEEVAGTFSPVWAPE